MKQNKETLKQFFETGDKPTQQQYADLIDSYVDAQQEAGEANRRFVIDETGAVNVASEQQAPEYMLSDVVNSKLSLLKDGVSVKDVDLITYTPSEVAFYKYSTTDDVNSINGILATTSNDFWQINQVTFNKITLNNVDTADLHSNAHAGLLIRMISKSDNFTSYLFYLESIDSNTPSTVTYNVKPVNHSGNYTFSDNTNYDVIFEVDLYKNVRPDWNEANPNSPAYITSKPNIPQYQAGTNITIDTTDPLQPIISASGGSMSITEGSFTPSFNVNGSSFSPFDWDANYYSVGDRFFVDIRLLEVTSNGTASNGEIEISLDDINPGRGAKYTAVVSVFNGNKRESYNTYMPSRDNIIYLKDEVLASENLYISVNYRQDINPIIA
ncbi:hypothetical protein P8625_10810 [Tenacibaculum tangerinum]|uniref:Uncharacterized protein n=1 Tax=Tenacibaculum tangerinum TaxID=3038772 RepID=A0ABY8L3J8_9FLAO|nr:hypothetical protein [Tenacibaculum tangerinum]WGH74579.1 hypothetical protein P8625_10810 [Tenacibaculum tangerinum]